MRGEDRHRAPAGTVTVLMGQVAGVPRAGTADPEVHSLALARVDRLLETAAGAHDGYVTPRPPIDEGFVVAFPRVAQAVRCAYALQTAATAERWPGGLDLRLRLGLHTGDVDLDDAGRYSGSAVERCARIRDLAHGGQTLLSATTHDILGDALDDDVWLEDLGLHRLRDLGRPQRVHQLRHRDLPSSFPPLRSLDALPNNLPVPQTSFHGRSQELTHLTRLLGETRLLTLTGSGGCGKTRLAVHLAANALPRFGDGAWWCDLAPVADPALVTQAVCSAIGLRRRAGEDVGDLLERELAHRQVLLILDNCEHVIDTTAELATRLLGSCPTVTIITTGREPLGVHGEVSRRVPSLAVPEHDELTVAELDQYPATRLFLDRASAAAEFRPTDDDAVSIAHICRDLDGLPLAIELAAARTRVLDVHEIAQGLSDRFGLLTSGERTALPRQRTLEASIAWSYDLLSTTEQIALARFSVFADSFDFAAARAVATSGDLEDDGVLELLSTLVDRSLVLVNHDPTGVRYRLLDSVRDYAAQRLEELGQTASARDRHLAHFTEVAARAGRNLRSSAFNRQAVALDRQIDDLRSAIRWAARFDRLDAVVEIIDATRVYWIVRSLFEDVGSALGAVLSAGGLSPDREARALALVADLSAMGGEYAVAIETGRRAEKLARSQGEDEALLDALLPISWSELFSGRSGVEEAQEAVAISERLDREDLTYRALLYLAFPLSQTDSPQDARPLLERATRLAAAASDPYFLSIAHFLAGIVASQTGDWDLASTHGETALRYGRSIEHAHVVSLSLVVVLAPVALLEGRYDEAREYIEEARAFQGEPDNALADMATSFAAAWDLALEQHDQVEAGLAPAAERWRERGAQWWVAHIQILRAASARARGETRLAREHLADILEDPLIGGTIWTDVRARHMAAALALDEGDLAEAESLAYEALGRAHEAGLVPVVVDLLELLGGLLDRLDDPTAAARALGAAARTREELGYVRPPVERSAYQQDLDHLRERLDPADLDDAWAEGAGLGWSAACEYLLRGRGSRGRPSHGWDSLTPTEIEVIRHVADGLSNPGIAEAMFVSRNTVKTHLSHVYAKLDLSGRTELAAEALRRGLVG